MFKPVIVAFNKPKGFVVSKDDKFNKTIYEFLPDSWKRDFFYVGRLDKDSNWLLLLTNVPELVNEIEHPSKNIFKIYEVFINKNLKTNLIKKFKKGFFVSEEWRLANHEDDKKFKDENIEFLQMYDVSVQKDNKWRPFLRVLLTYWKKRHIRRMLKAVWYDVKSLTRIKFWKYELWNLKSWQYNIHPLKIRKWKKLNII